MSDFSYDSENEVLVVTTTSEPQEIVTTYPRAQLVREVGACQSTIENATAEKAVWDARLAEFDKQAALHPKPVVEPEPEVLPEEEVPSEEQPV